jgi:hypothetical protein
MRGFYQRVQQREEFAESPPHPVSRYRAKPTSPRRRGGGKENAAKQLSHRSRPPLRIDDVAQTVAEQIEAEHRDHQRKARKQRDPPFP